MKNQKIISLLLVLLLVALGAYRSMLVLISPMGGGRSLESPDKHYQATASTLSSVQFWGGERYYYEFVLEKNPNDSRQVIKRLSVEPQGEKRLNWYAGQGVIEWAKDSSAVTYQFGNSQLTLKLR